MRWLSSSTSATAGASPRAARSKSSSTLVGGSAALPTTAGLRLPQQDQASGLVGGGRAAALVVRGEGEEGDLAGGSVGAPQQLALMHDPSAHAGAHSDDGERPQVLGSPLPLLTDGCEVDVVVEDDLRSQRLLQGRTEVERSALSDVPGVVHGGAIGVDDAGDGHPHDGRDTRPRGPCRRSPAGRGSRPAVRSRGRPPPRSASRVSATTWPRASVNATRMLLPPMSTPITAPALAATSYSEAERPGSPTRWPTSVTRSRSVSRSIAAKTVGRDRSHARAISGRLTGCSCSSRNDSTFWALDRPGAEPPARPP